MDEIGKIKKGKIVEILKVVLENILLELYFNIQYSNQKIALGFNISDDGETIMFNANKNWIDIDGINYEAYSTIKVEKDTDELSKLIGSEILNIKFGIGKTQDTKKEVIYYIKINTDKTEFLFFNNGDAGAYSFDKTESILENDIYGFEWSSKPPIE